jgi:hypothetical protein
MAFARCKDLSIVTKSHDSSVEQIIWKIILQPLFAVWVSPRVVRVPLDPMDSNQAEGVNIIFDLIILYVLHYLLKVCLQLGIVNDRNTKDVLH